MLQVKMRDLSTYCGYNLYINDLSWANCLYSSISIAYYSYYEYIEIIFTNQNNSREVNRVYFSQKRTFIGTFLPFLKQI